MAHRPGCLPPSRRYLFGRVIATLIAIGGAIGVLAALAWLGLFALAPEVLGQLPPFSQLFSGPAIAVSAATSGLVLVLLAQLARALLDQANATADLAALARARAEQDAAEAAPVPPRGQGHGPK